jgi:hypothetical protein
MPTYVPSRDELDSVHEAVRKYSPEDFGAFRGYLAFVANPRRWAPVPLPIKKLLDDFARMEAGDWPGDPRSWPKNVDLGVIPPILLDNPGSLTLALALAILRPDWDVAAAEAEYLWMQSRLLAAWQTNGHSEKQKRHKTFDEVVAFGAQQGAGWPLPSEVVYFHVFSACILSSLFLEGPPVGRGLIPDLTASWGRNFRNDVGRHAAGIRAWLLLPSVYRPFIRGSFLEFTGGPDGCEVLGFDVVPTGSKRNLILTEGAARLVDHNGALVGAVSAGQHLMLGSFDEGEVRIRIAHIQSHRGGQNVGGPGLRIGKNRPCGRLLFDADSVLETWSCTCGLFNCDKKHRILAWDPAAFPPRASLKSFLWTAVKGPGGGRAVQLGKFVGSMYYAYLSEGLS